MRVILLEPIQNLLDGLRKSVDATPPIIESIKKFPRHFSQITLVIASDPLPNLSGGTTSRSNWDRVSTSFCGDLKFRYDSVRGAASCSILFHTRYVNARPRLLTKSSRYR
jgi:hypothetical protein